MSRSKTRLGSLLAIGLLFGAAQTAAAQTDTETSTASAGCDTPLAEPGVYDGINDFEGADQAYRVVVPEGYADGAPVPLILFPAAGRGFLEASFELWQPYLDPARSIFVTAAQTIVAHTQAPTLTALLDQLAADYCIDTRRVHAMGMSSSGPAAARLACMAPDRIASFSVVVGGFFVPDTCSRPLLAVTGERDRVRVGQPMERWTEQNGCDPEPVQEDLGSGVTRSTYQGCPDDTVLYDIEGAGHGFIRHECADPPLYCFENEVFDVLRELESFIAEHPLSVLGD